MHWFKRAVLHNARKKGKTLLLFSILLVIGILLLTCFSIQRATETAALNVRRSLKGSFTIDAKASNGQLTGDVVQAIRQLPGIKEYNGRSTSYAAYSHANGTPLEIMTAGAFQIVEGFEHAGKVVADSFSEQDELFTESGFTLLEGSPITDGEAHAAVIHRWLAEQNNLQIGDTIRLGLNRQMVSDDTMNAEGAADKTVPVKIIGIFENTRPQEGDTLFSHIFYQNTIFVDHQSYSQLFPENSLLYCETADFQVDDPEKLDDLIEQIQEIDGVAWEKCTFTKHAVDYENARDSLQTLEEIVWVLSLVVLAVSAGLLLLIFALWARSLVHETGVYVAMGIGKGNVLLQHLTEVCLIAVCAFIIAAACSSGIAGGVGEHLLKQAAAPEYETTQFTQTEQPEQTQDIVELTQIQINVAGQDILLLCGAGIPLIVLSVTLAALPVLRLKPKEILTKMN